MTAPTAAVPLLALPPHHQLRRRGLPTITGGMVPVLIALRDIADDDCPFLPLDDVDPRTLRALEDRDWIVQITARLEITHYKITGRGLEALEVYLPQVKRNDGLCPRCGIRKRRIFKTGRQGPYCRQCASKIHQRTYKLGLYRMRPQGLCAKCEKRPRFVASSGKVYSYCKRCKNLNRRREHARERARLLDQVQAGEHVACRREGCFAPRYVSGSSVQDYCYEHYREYQNSYMRTYPRSGK